MISITLGSLEMLPLAWHSQSTHAARTPTPEVLQKLPTPGLVLPTWQPPLCGSSSPEEVRAECRLKAARSRTVMT
jgi:hypothetical protein